MQSSTLTGKTYRLEYTDALTANDWHLLTEDIPGEGHPVLLTDPAALTLPYRFYRLRVIQP